MKSNWFDTRIRHAGFEPYHDDYVRIPRQALMSMTKIKAYIASVVAFIACPCHLPLTLPLLISLTAGTAFGTWLAQNTVLVGAISTVAFIGGLALAYRWVNQPYCPPTKTPTAKVPYVPSQD